MDESTCVSCGCTDSAACVPFGCSWYVVFPSEGLGICSNCMTKDAEATFTQQLAARGHADPERLDDVEASQVLGVQVETIRRHAKTGRLPGYLYPFGWRFQRADVQAHTVQPRRPHTRRPKYAR